MTHKLIKTENYLLVVDDSEIKKGDWCYAILSKQTFENINPNLKSEDKKKIIAHLPLNGSSILEGVDLLPPLEDGIEEAEKAFTEVLDIEPKQVYDKMLLDATEHGFIIGYNKAREKYKYTEEDVRKAITMARDLEDWQDLVWEYEYDDIIQSLHQYPTEFECEMEQYYNEVGNDGFEFDSSSTIPPPRPKTITTAQGVEWVGKYK
jgi:hypothetical protein